MVLIDGQATMGELNVPVINVGDMIYRQAAIDTIMSQPPEPHYPSWYAEQIKSLPPEQPDEKLEKCRFEYIHACRIVTCPTPDTTKKDISDAYAVIKVLQPIFGDVPFAKVKRGDSDGTD